MGRQPKEEQIPKHINHMQRQQHPKQVGDWDVQLQIRQSLYIKVIYTIDCIISWWKKLGCIWYAFYFHPSQQGSKPCLTQILSFFFCFTHVSGLAYTMYTSCNILVHICICSTYVYHQWSYICHGWHIFHIIFLHISDTECWLQLWRQ